MDARIMDSTSRIFGSTLPTIDFNLPNIHSEKSTSIQTNFAMKLSYESNRTTSSKKRKYHSKQIDDDSKNETVKPLLKRAKQNFSSSFSDSHEEIQQNGSSSDGEQMEIDLSGEESEDGAEKTLVINEKREEELNRCVT
jgi:hypothetical protein